MLVVAVVVGRGMVVVVTRYVCPPGLNWENRRMPKCVTEGGRRGAQR